MKYIWNSNWIMPYESLWNIIEKFKYINVLTNKELKKILNFKPNRNTLQTSNIFYIYRNNTFEESIVLDFFNLTDSHFEMLSMYKYNSIFSLMNKEIYYCPECIKIGYHSFYHQIKFMKKCIFHDIFLEKASDDSNIPCVYSISSSANEAYKNGVSTSKKIINKYLPIPTASHLIVYSYGLYNELYNLNNSWAKYENLRFFNPIYSSRNKYAEINEKTYSFISNIFYNGIVTENLIYEIPRSECMYNYSNLNEQMEKFRTENNLNAYNVIIWKSS